MKRGEVIFESESMAQMTSYVFNAPIAEADMPAIVDYLVKTYGNEQTKP